MKIQGVGRLRELENLESSTVFLETYVWNIRKLLETAFSGCCRKISFHRLDSAR